MTALLLKHTIKDFPTGALYKMVNLNKLVTVYFLIFPVLEPVATHLPVKFF